MSRFITAFLTVVIITLTVVFIFGIGFGFGNYQKVNATQQTLPIKLLDADIPRLLVLQERGGTYTRFAEPSGAWGIVAVRMKGGIWVVPCYEVGASSGGKK